MKKTTLGRKGGAVREDRKRKDAVRRDDFSGQNRTVRREPGGKSGLQAQRVLMTFYVPQGTISH